MAKRRFKKQRIWLFTECSNVSVTFAPKGSYIFKKKIANCTKYIAKQFIHTQKSTEFTYVFCRFFVVDCLMLHLGAI